MNILDCCVRGSLQSDIEVWLVPEIELQQFNTCHIQLFRCPSCGALWVRKAELVGHKEWDYTLDRILSRKDFDILIEAQRQSDQVALEKLKQLYVEHGLEWPSGLKRR